MTTDILTIRQIARLTGRSRRTVIRWFEHEPGVIVLARAERMHKRRYRSMRVPREVFDRVLRRYTVT